METDCSRKMANDEIPERKASYRKAVGADTTKSQMKAAHLNNATVTFSDDPVVQFSSDDGLSSFGSANYVDKPIETFFLQRHAEQDREEKPKREKWTDFADNTSLHGFHFIFTRASPWVRLVWIFFLLGFTGYVIFSIYSSIHKYFTYPIATTMKIYYPEEGMQFPAVTLCPTTTLSKTRISMEDKDPSFNKLGLDIAACNTTAAVRAGRPCGEALLCCCTDYTNSEISVVLPNCTEDYRKDLLEVIKKKKESFNDRQFHEAYGPSIRRMIIPGTCQYGLSEEGCSHKDFDPIVTELGRCYSFNAARHGEEVLKAFHGDTLSGLSLVLDLNLHDHMVGYYSEGIWVIVHHQGVYINPWNRILVAPGTHTEISVKRKVYRNKKPPYETECSETKRLAGYKKYTSEGCYTECLSNATARKCGCRWSSDSGLYYCSSTCCTSDNLSASVEGMLFALSRTVLPGFRGCLGSRNAIDQSFSSSTVNRTCWLMESKMEVELSRCERAIQTWPSSLYLWEVNFGDRVCFREDGNCTKTVINDVFEGTIKCDCPLACDVINYESTMSSAVFPNPTMIKILQNKGYNRTNDYLRKNLVLLQVGYSSLRYEYFKQTSQYDSGALMGEIGGNLGLFLGCSILTIFEFVDFTIYLCRTRNKKKL